MDSLNNLQAIGLLYAYMWMFVIGSGAWMTLATLAAGLSIARINLGFGPTIKSTNGPIAVRIGLIPMGSYVTQPENEAGDFKPFPTGVRLACHAGNMAIPAIVVLLAIGAAQGVDLHARTAMPLHPMAGTADNQHPAGAGWAVPHHVHGHGFAIAPGQGVGPGVDRQATVMGGL